MMVAHALEPQLRLGELLRGTVVAALPADPEISAITLDSRRVSRGALYLALRGSRTHGSVYIDQAIAQGAAAVLWESEAPVSEIRGGVPVIGLPDLARRAGLLAERFFGEPSRALSVVGVTGTNGKTSCTHFIAQCLQLDAPCGVVGTLGNGVYGRLAAGTHTTPDAVTLHALLAEMVQLGARHAVMEVSSHGLDQGRVAGVVFDVALFTNLSRDHLDYHVDMESYAHAKRKLFHMAGLKHAVINADDAYGQRLLAEPARGVDYVSYGLLPECAPTVFGSGLQLGLGGLTMQVSSPWGEGVLRTALLGRFNASNVLAVLTTLLVLGVPLAEALVRIERLRPVPGRMECFGGHAGAPLVVVDYAHTPDALEQVLRTLRDLLSQSADTGQLWCVFGCGGDRDRGKRPLMGAAAERLCDRLVITDDNPRTEDGDAIVAEIMSGLTHSSQVWVERDRAMAITQSIVRAQVEDVILVAGKGHENYQIVGEQRLPFDDRDVVRRALQMRAELGGV